MSNVDQIPRLRAVLGWGTALAAALALAFPAASLAVQPDAKTVSWVASNPLIPHDAFSGEATILKCTSSVAGPTIEYTWDFGDGSPVQTGVVVQYGSGISGTQRMRYAIDASHVYTDSVGTVFTARCTVRDTSTGESDSANYLVQIREKTLQAQVNVAIDRGLWFLHKAMIRNNEGGAETGDWLSAPVGSVAGNQATYQYYAITPNNVTAFLANGHLENGSADNPYAETVQRAMRRVFQLVSATSISATRTMPAASGIGTYTVDTNGNGLGIVPAGGQSYPFYQSGMFFNAIVASANPDAVTTTGPTNVIGRKYRDIVQDMADYMYHCQYNGSTSFGGWRYNCGEGPDGSVVQWVAIGLIGAERSFGTVVPWQVKQALRNWIDYSQDSAGGYGYTSPAYYPWGPYAVAPSGQVQQALVGRGRGFAGWDKGETFLRDRFCNGGGPNANMRAYYYGLFSFTKSMLLHDSNADGTAEPLELLQSQTAGVPPIDWYDAQASAGAPCNGVARTLVNDQNAAGYWSGHNYDSRQYPFETGWAILMLNRSVFEAGQPVAVIKATPNPSVAFQVIQLSGADSFHQDPQRSITSWAWDLDNDGEFDDATGPNTSKSFPAVGDYVVRLRVCDSGTPQLCGSSAITLRVATPPIAPTANAGGPYNFCQNRTPYFLDGAKSSNPDEGQSEPGQPGDTIIAFDWDLNGDGTFGDVTGVQPNVTANFPAVGDFLIQLRVTDRTSVSFPSSGQPNLTGTDSAQVKVRAATDPACACISNLAARAKSGKIQLTWTWSGLPAGGSYNVYRGTVNGGPYAKIASTASTYSTYLDGTVVNGTTYFYVVRPADLSGAEPCQSNQASAKATAR